MPLEPFGPLDGDVQVLHRFHDDELEAAITVRGGRVTLVVWPRPGALRIPYRYTITERLTAGRLLPVVYRGRLRLGEDETWTAELPPSSLEVVRHDVYLELTDDPPL